MLTLLEFALQNLLFIGLHLDSRSSFPKQLSPKEEEECIALIAQGDMDARGKSDVVHDECWLCIGVPSGTGKKLV